ncbi:flavin monoamine oxidase family protein [Paenisporosarcina cavernae]|uniref:Amine oxidase n=1 Tax=Paenisporosarcina cavernae TaxID=2320858 RepID=A0A385YVH6_9BACL|nr:FAD-dependent oxidoreductase [Paenisporosarcina cavernae]AYC30544.1 amine oxidase [Paenisporosarcina cavernae]
MDNFPVVIIGAGLSGLRIASLLMEHNIPFKVIEARERVGGRVLTASASSSQKELNVDLGPTWFWPESETFMTKLVHELKLETFEQYTTGAMLSERTPSQPPERFHLPENAIAKSRRFEGGVQSLIDALYRKIPLNQLELSTRAVTVQLLNNSEVVVESICQNGEHKKEQARAVVMTVPPRIISRDIQFIPSLPTVVTTHLQQTATWMAGQAKFVAVYDRPFWREKGLSGYATSWVGPLQEIHDASPQNDGAALFGFVGIPAIERQSLGKDQVIQFALDQLVRLFGQEAASVKEIFYQDWSLEKETATKEDFPPLRDFPHYHPILVKGEWNNKIFFAGTETSAEFGGHLEGALRSAEFVVEQLRNLNK